MIAVDSSALLAIVLREPEAMRCTWLLNEADSAIISAATLTETFIVASGRRVEAQIHEVVERSDLDVIPVDEATAYRVEKVYRTWGRGFHKAALNFGDCFAYDVAREHGCPLLYVGDDFSQTDISSAL